MVHKTDGELGRITTSFVVQCISHGKVPARAIRKSSVGHGVFKKHALGCTCALVSIGSSSYSRSSFVNAIGPRLSPRMHQTHTALPKKTAELPLYVFALSTCLSKTRLAFRLRRTHVGDLVRVPAKLVMSWMELKFCGAADAGGVDGKNIIRSSTTWSVSSHPTIMDVLFALCAPWTPRCCIRRIYMHVTMTASFKPQRNTIYRKHHHLCDCKKLECTPPHTIPPTSLHLNLRHPTTTQYLTDHFQSRSIHLVFTKLIYLGPELETFSCTTHIVSLSFCSIHADCCSGSICERAKFHHSTRYSAI